MKKLFFVIIVLLIEFSAIAQNTNNLLNNYISVKNALVDSNGKAASETINALFDALKKEENFPERTELMKATEKLHKAGNDINKQKAAFNNVSTLMWDLVKDSEKVNETVYYQYCPMKKAYWLSKEKEIKNPFYGDAMLSCGKIVETKE